MCINHPKTSFTIKESKHRHYGYSMSTMSVFDDKKKISMMHAEVITTWKNIFESLREHAM